MHCGPRGCGIERVVGELVVSLTAAIVLDAAAVADGYGHQSYLGTEVVVRRACFGMPALEAAAVAERTLERKYRMGCKIVGAVAAAQDDQRDCLSSQ